METNYIFYERSWYRPKWFIPISDWKGYTAVWAKNPYGTFNLLLLDSNRCEGHVVARGNTCVLRDAKYIHNKFWRKLVKFLYKQGFFGVKAPKSKPLSGGYNHVTYVDDVEDWTENFFINNYDDEEVFFNPETYRYEHK